MIGLLYKLSTMKPLAYIILEFVSDASACNVRSSWKLRAHV